MQHKLENHTGNENIAIYTGHHDSTLKPCLFGITYKDPNYCITRPSSSIYSIDYVLDGNGTIHQNNLTYHPKQGDLYILHPHTNQYYYSNPDNPWKKIWLNIFGDFIDHLFEDYKLNNIVYVKNFNNSSHLFNMFNMVKQNPSVSRDKIALEMHKLVIDISEFLKKKKAKKSPAHNMKQYIDNNMNNSISISDLQNIVHFSRTHTINLFKKEFGVSPHEYITSEKLRLAKNLLKNTTLSIAEISESLAFNDANYFSSFFRQATGETPLNYRKREKIH